MRYLVVLLLLLCSCTMDHDEELKAEADLFCKCHQGIKAFVYNEMSWNLECMDGSTSSGQGLTSELHLYSNCKK